MKRWALIGGWVITAVIASNISKCPSGRSWPCAAFHVSPSLVVQMKQRYFTRLSRDYYTEAFLCDIEGECRFLARWSGYQWPRFKMVGPSKLVMRIADIQFDSIHDTVVLPDSAYGAWPDKSKIQLEVQEVALKDLAEPGEARDPPYDLACVDG